MGEVWRGRESGASLLLAYGKLFVKPNFKVDALFKYDNSNFLMQ